MYEVMRDDGQYIFRCIVVDENKKKVLEMYKHGDEEMYIEDSAGELASVTLSQTGKFKQRYVNMDGEAKDRILDNINGYRDFIQCDSVYATVEGKTAYVFEDNRLLSVLREKTSNSWELDIRHPLDLAWVMVMTAISDWWDRGNDGLIQKNNYTSKYYKNKPKVVKN